MVLINISSFRSLTILLPSVVLAAAAVNNTIYVISNAETPSLRLPGLTPVGLQRAQDCLPPLLAPLDLGLIITCPLDEETGLCSSTGLTAQYTADYIGLTVDVSCGADEETDDDCVVDLIKDFAKTSDQNILIVWDMNDIDNLFENLDVNDDWNDENEELYDDEEDAYLYHDLLYTIVRKRVTAAISQGCNGIDGQAPGTYRRSLGTRSYKAKRQVHKQGLISRIARSH